MARRIKGERPKIEGPRVNERIRISQVRVVDSDGSQLGVMPTNKARNLAYNQGLDLVEVAPNSRPPVAKIMDFGKFKYEEKRKKNEAKKNAAKNETKQIKLRPKTDEHDLGFKTKSARKFLEAGYKVQLEVRFRGRENSHPGTGKAALDKIVLELMDVGKIERAPKLENRSMIMILAPK